MILLSISPSYFSQNYQSQFWEYESITFTVNYHVPDTQTNVLICAMGLFTNLKPITELASLISKVGLLQFLYVIDGNVVVLSEFPSITMFENFQNVYRYLYDSAHIECILQTFIKKCHTLLLNNFQHQIHFLCKNLLVTMALTSSFCEELKRVVYNQLDQSCTILHASSH